MNSDLYQFASHGTYDGGVELAPLNTLTYMNRSYRAQHHFRHIATRVLWDTFHLLTSTVCYEASLGG